MVIRKYTPPTCTLEIQAKESPLSRWAGRPVLKQLRFELRFDDPRQPEEKRVTIWGDRTELEALHEAVTTYVQDFLGQSPALMPLGSLQSAMPSWESFPTSLLAAYSKPAQENLDSLSPLQSAPPTLYLQPRGLLTHDLFLGPLETEVSGPFVSLSALQLYDLATALDEYAAEMVGLPALGRPIWRQTPPPWTKAAALVVMTVGLTTAGLKLLDNRASTNSQNAAKAPSPPSSRGPQTPVVAKASPVPTQPETTPPVPTPPAARPTSAVSPPLLNTPARVLPPPPVNVPPPPRTRSQPLVIPDTATASPRTSSQPLIIPEIGTTPPRSSSQPLVVPEIGTTPPPRGSQPLVVPGRGTTPRRFSPPPPLASASPVLIPRTPPTQSTSSRVALKQQPLPRSQPQVATPQEQPAESPAPAPAPTPTIAALPSPPSLSNRSRAPKEGETPDSPPQLSASSPIPSAPEDSRDTARAAEPTYSSSRPESLSTGMIHNGSVPQNGGETDIAANSRLFDTIPQVAQIRDYFKQKWKPPQELTQRLEYNLVLNRNGSLDRFIPLGSAAATYIDSTNMPSPGQPFVSAFDRGSTPTIRLVLYPDGRVETLLVEPTK